MKRICTALCVSALSACTQWSAAGGASTGTAKIGGDEYTVVYVTSAPGVYDMRAPKFRLTEGIAAENKAFVLDATGQVANQLCGGNAEMVSIERIDNNALYEARWRCR